MESITPKSKLKKTPQWWWKERVLPRAIFLKQRWQGADRCYVTCRGNQDGLGAQLQAHLSGMLYAHCQGLTYVHSPMTSLDFTPANEHDLGEPRRVDNPTQIRMIRDSFWSVPNCHAYADIYPERYLRLTRQFAARYRDAPKDGCVPHYTPRVVNIAVHLRRGSDLGHKMFLWSRDEYCAALLQVLVEALRDAGAQFVIRVFSQGVEEDFPALRRFGVEFHLDEDLFPTFHSLVLADVLLTAKSALSYVAAILSSGLIIYQPMHHAPLPNWLAAGEDGSLDRRRLAQRLRAYLDSYPG
jgi:hypothetical protein